MCQPSAAILSRRCLKDLARGGIHQPLDEIEAHAAHAGFVNRRQFVSVISGRRKRHPWPGRALERVHDGAIVVAVAGGLHDDVALEAEEIAQGEELLLGRVAGRVFALRRIGKCGSGPKTWQCASTAPAGGV